MKLVPNAVSRFAGRSLLKLNASSPTILVVTGVVGFGVTAVMAARATRGLDKVMEEHEDARFDAKGKHEEGSRELSKALIRVYTDTGLDLTKLYGPTVFVGTLSAASVLSGHRIMKTRYVGVMAAYSGLFEKFEFYRDRVAATVGREREKEIYDGAVLVYEEDPNNPGEYKQVTRQAEKGMSDTNEYRPWFDETNRNWLNSWAANNAFLKGVQSNMNNCLQVNGHVFLNEVHDALGFPRTRAGAVTGWMYGGEGDDFIDFGFMTGTDPNTIAFRNQVETRVQLDFNVDGIIFDKI